MSVECALISVTKEYFTMKFLPECYVADIYRGTTKLFPFSSFLILTFSRVALEMLWSLVRILDYVSAEEAGRKMER